MTVGSLILHQRYRKRLARYVGLSQEVASTFEEPDSDNERLLTTRICNSPSGSTCNSTCDRKTCGNLPTINESLESPVLDIEDLFAKPIANGTNSTRGESTRNESMDSTQHRSTQHGSTQHGSTQNGTTQKESTQNGLKKRVSTQQEESTQDFNAIDLAEGNVDQNVDLCPSGFGCRGPTRTRCHEIIQQYQERIDEDMELIEEEPEAHDPQILRHVVLLIMLLCSMFVGLAMSIWTLVMEKLSGIYVELSFLDATLNFGQALIVFGIFGTDSKEISIPLFKLWRKLRHGGSVLTLPSRDELSSETKHVCEQFTGHHLNKCKREIAEDKRWRLKVYRNVFSGSKFVDWLIELGLARDRVEAVNYARHLIEGRVLRHINGVYHFYDRNLLYTFV